MQHDTNSPAGSDAGMHLRKITLQDGRYMIFYTFDDSPSADAAGNSAGESGRNADAPLARPESEEERNV